MDRGKEDGKQAMQAHRSTLVLRQKAVLGSGNPGAQRSEADGKAHRLTLVLRQKGGSRVWQPWSSTE